MDGLNSPEDSCCEHQQQDGTSTYMALISLEDEQNQNPIDNKEFYTADPRWVHESFIAELRPE